MAKKKPAAEMLVSDGAGGMIALQDRRLDDEPWPHVFEISAGRADAWIEYLQAECDVRGWQLVSVGQMEAEENSGSITIRTQSGPESPEVIVVWERRRHGPLEVRARPAGQPALSPDEAAEFLIRVNNNFHTGVTSRFYERAYLYYEGLPWRGELWLGDELRLGPPSRYADALFGPQIIVIDAVSYAPSWRGAREQFDSKVRELGIFLSVVMHTSVGVPHDQEVWTTTLEGTRSQLGRIGYFEESALTDLPRQGQNPPVPLRPVTRPDFGHQGLTADDHEQWLPADVFDLWLASKELSHEKWEQFQRVGALYKLACGLWHESATTSLALLVVACEALKPEGKKSKTVNVYGVVESLLGTDHARRLEVLRHPPQSTRSRHLHGAALFASELAPRLMLSTFRDPSFRHDYGAVKQVVTASMVEWLQRRGNFKPVRRKGDGWEGASP